MQRLPQFGLALVLTLLFIGSASARYVDLGGEPLEVTLLAGDAERSVIEITLGGFDAEAVTIYGETYNLITLPGGHVDQVTGLPALPDIRRSLIIPDDQAMSVRVLSETHVDLPNMPVAPSKGHFPRSINPEEVPYTFDAFYESAGIYPEVAAEGHAPYILRDFRGMVADMNPFQYMPASKTLRVYTHMVVEVVAIGPSVVNTFTRAGLPAVIDKQFAKLYERRFFNYAAQRYDPVLEDGGLLIISYDAFVPEMTDFVEWKRQKGIATKLVGLSETGTTYSQINSYIEQEFAAWNMAYVLLIGDAEQVPKYGSDSDPAYSTIAGNDDYPEIFVGRFSAENASQLATQVERTIAYERDQQAGAVWPQYGMGVASNQGPGHYGEYDDEHEDLIRADLLAYGYFAVDQIYDPYGTATMVANGLNEGRGIVNYTGHGSTTSWGSTGFSNTHVNALTNDGMLPFICSVACNNGTFTSGTCFAEAWLRATNGGIATGAIACYMSYISQSWDPPMDAQDEAVDLLIADEMRTVGGLWFNGSCLMIDINGASGANEFLNWMIFGDPSVAVRTKAAQEMTVSHTGTLMLGQDTYDLTVPGVPGALCALYADGTIYGTATTDAAGAAQITLDPVPGEPMNLTLTVTAYNKVTQIDLVEVIPAEGPYLVIGGIEYYAGGDEEINAGEAVQMRVKLRNVGIEDAINIAADISTVSEYIAITTGSLSYPDIPAGGEAWCDGFYGFDVDPACPDLHGVQMPMVINGDERITWESTINFVVHAPTILVADIEIDDTVGGDGNYHLDPGETATIAVTLRNDGSGRLDDIAGLFTCNHPLIAVNTGSGAITGGLGQGENGLLEPIFEISIDPDFTAFDCDFDLGITGTNAYDRIFEIMLPIGGFFETIEDGAPDWSHYIVGATFNDQWHLSTQRNHTPNGSQSWKCGDTGAGDYSNLLDAGLETPAVAIGDEAELVFWMWIDAEESGAYAGRAYDGGLIEMSVDGGPFEQIEPIGGYTHTIRTGSTPGPFSEDTPVFSGATDWTEVRCDLSGHEGNVSFRFRFGSDGADTREGWYIDDVEVLGLANLAGAEEELTTPVRLTLMPSRPNPSRGMTQVRFALPHAGDATLAIYDTNGRLVRTLLDGTLSAGLHQAAWDGADANGHRVASGLYYYRLSTVEGTVRRSMVMLR